MTLVEDTEDKTTFYTPAVDETGGLALFVEMLWDKRDAATGAHPTVTIPTTTTETTAQPAESHAPGLMRRTLSRAKAAISRAVATVREATKWLFSDMPSLNPKLITRFRNRFFGYRGRHNVQRAWYGVQRSTAASVAITRERHMRAQQTSNVKEGVLSSYFELPEYWTSHMANLIQVIRDEHAFLRPSTGRHW